MRTVLSYLALAVALVSATNLRAEVWLNGAVASAGGRQIMTNPGLEAGAGDQAAGWVAWPKGGYQVDDRIVHTGKRSARCTYASADLESGVYQHVELNQTEPTAILAKLWSRAENVSGYADNDYSLYLDLEYTDGTPLYGQTYPFNTGTHDWQQGTVLIMPPKPVKSLTIYGIFRHHEGTAWFDDFELYQVPGVGMFDLQPATGNVPAAKGRLGKVRLGTAHELLVDMATGAMSFDPTRTGGLLLRDAAAGSSFVRPKLKVQPGKDGWELTGEAPELKLAVDAALSLVGTALRLNVVVRDLSGKDRAITAYWALPLPAGAWTWHQDARTSYEVGPARSGLYYANLGCGSNGQASKHPFGAVTSPAMGLGLGTPITEPRLVRFAMDGPRRTLYAACDVGLSPVVKNSPSAASFSFQLFDFAPEWGFRAALKGYYDLNAQAFKPRAEKQGLWMPFVDVSTVQGWEDFGFQFQEGAPNAAWDEAHGIYSFPYIEPLSYWMGMPKDVPRTDAAALKQLDELAAKGDRQAIATKNSAFCGPDGRLRMSIQNAPWCDGALFLNNASPGVSAPPTAPWTQYKIQEEAVKHIVGEQTTNVDWRAYAGGFTLARGEGRNGSTAAFCERAAGDGDKGVTQDVNPGQTEPHALIATAWSKAEGVTGDADKDYSIYIDLTYNDDTTLFGQITPFATGTHDWQQVTVRIVPQKPVRSMAINLLLRGNHAGKVWFDDVSVREEGSDQEFVRDGGFEGPQKAVRLDGLYLDSFEMASTDLDYSRAHIAGAQLPVVYDRAGRLCQLGYFISMEMMMPFARQIHDSGRMMFANAVLWNFPWCAGFLDVMGTETNWEGEGGAYTPVSDEQMLYWRAMCYKRPYLTLQNTVFEKFPHEWVEKYFARCCYYGVLPSFFSHNAADAVYWNRPELYNRDRDLFRKYIPVIRAADEAGWEPVTLATVDAPDVWVERFGTGSTVYFTVFNAGKSAADAKLRVDLQALGAKAGAKARAKAQMLLPTAGDLGTATGDVWAQSVSLQPEQVAVVKLSW